MYKIIDTRGTGKTSRLMLIAKENDALFVCANPASMRQKAYSYGIIGIDFIVAHFLVKVKENKRRRIKPSPNDFYTGHKLFKILFLYPEDK